MSVNRRKVLLIVLIAVAWNAPRAYAGDLSFGAGYAGEYSDNILHTTTGMQEEWTNIYLAGIAYRELGQELAASIDASAVHHDYTRGSYSDETLGYLNAAALWTILPQRFVWTITDRLDQLPRNATDPLSPVNRDAVNVLETGPDFLIPITPASTLILGARAGNVWFREGNDDYNSYSVAVRWRHRLDSTSTVSANMEGAKIIHTETVTPPVTTALDYVRETAYLRYDQRLSWSRIVLDAGATRFIPDDGTDDVDEPLVRISLARRLTSESTIGLSFGRELLDVGGTLLAGVADPTIGDAILAPPPIPGELASGAVFRSRRGDGFYTYSGHALTTQVALFYRDLDYLTTLDDRTETGSGIRITYNLSATFAVGAYGTIQRTEYQDTDRLDRDVSYGASISYRFTPQFSFSIEGAHTDRNSTDLLGSYEESRGMVRLYYSSHPHFSPVGRR